MSTMTSDEALAIATDWLTRLRAGADASNAETFAAQIMPAGWLRDLLCFSWDFRTIAGSDKVATFLSESDQASGRQPRLAHAGLYDIKLQTTTTIGPPAPFTPPNNPVVQGVSGAFSFAITSPPAVGRAFFRLLKDVDGVWRAHTLFTNLQDLKGHEELNPENGYPDRIWEEAHAERIAEIERDPTVLILGAGHSGLMCAARFGRMSIRSLVVEKTARVGDVWRQRYPNLSLHTPSYHSYFLYHPYPKTFPKFLPKEKIADFLEAYGIGQEVHVWLSSQIVSAPVYDDCTCRWSVEVDRAGKRVTVMPRHILVATGSMGKPRIPRWPGMESFKGQMYHSDEHRGAAPFKSKRVVVIGACNAGADMCQDFVLKGAAEVTMVQRSATCVLAASTADEALFRDAYPPHYSPEDQDFVMNSVPPVLRLKMAPGITQRLKALDKPLHEGLAKAGMKLTWEMTPGGDEVGLLGFLFERSASGTMMDMGCGQLIIDGKIKIKQGVEIEKFEPDAVVFADGSKIEADVVVLAAVRCLLQHGLRPDREKATSIFSDDIKNRIGPKIWGMDEEGEMTRVYRPAGVPKLWFALGAFQQLRFFSKHLALQILANELGLKT